MDKRQQKIDRILDTLREGTDDVRRNPSGENYRKWEGKITQAGRDGFPLWAVMLGAVFLCVGLIIVYQVLNRSRRSESNSNDPGCYLYNDAPNYSTVNVRSNCDVRPCGYDESTIIGEYPNNTPVQVSNNSGKSSGRFTWVRVVLISSGQTVWVASNKVRCQ